MRLALRLAAPAALAFALSAPAAHAVSTTAVIALQRSQERRIVALDPVSLRPVARAIPVRGDYAGGFAVSPDRRSFAVLTSVRGGKELTIVRRSDFKAVRRVIVHGIDLYAGDQVKWPVDERIAVIASADAERLVSIDPRTGRKAAEDIRIEAPTVATTTGGYTFVLRTDFAFDSQQQPNLSVVKPDGKLFSTTPLPDVGLPDDQFEPDSLALDPLTRRPVVLAPLAAHVDEVDPETGAFIDHPVPGLTGLRSTFAGPGSGGRLAVNATQQRRGSQRLFTLNTRDWTTSEPWSVRGNGEPAAFGDVVLTPSGFTAGSALRGVRATTLTGRPLWQGVTGHRVREATRIGSRVYADTQGIGLSVLSARTGRTLATRATSQRDSLQFLGSAGDGRRVLESPELTV